MTKFFLLFPVMLLILSCNQPVPISQAELKQIFTDIIKEDSLTKPYYIVDSLERVEEKSLTEEGVTYKTSYCSAIKNNIWNSELFDSAKIVSKAYIDSSFKNKNSDLALPRYRFTMPYLSEDKLSLLIYYDLYCGNLCAENSLRLYKRINGKWKYIKYYYRIVS
jgi:hypothetical protein